MEWISLAFNEAFFKCRELVLSNCPGTLSLLEAERQVCKAGVSLWLRDLSVVDHISKIFG